MPKDTALASAQSADNIPMRDARPVHYARPNHGWLN